MQCASEHRITWPDFFDGGAEIRIAGKSMIRLAELAGAPWSDSDPDAKLSDLQKQIITAPERTIVLFGGSRGGKSVAGAVFALAELMKPGARIALIGASYEHCSKEFGYIARGFFKLFPRSAAKEFQFSTRAPNFSMRLVTAWGASLFVYSLQAKEGGQILGSEFDMVVLCEAAQVAPEIFHTKVERALMGRGKRRSSDGYLRQTGRAIMLTTPKQLGGASYDVYSRAVARTRGKLERLHLGTAPWLESLRFFQANVHELNPSYPIEAMEAARRTLPKHAYEEQFLGMATVRSGLAYSSYSEDKTVLETEDDRRPTPEQISKSIIGVGIDTGKFAAVLAAMLPSGKVVILDECKELGQNTAQNAQSTLEMVERRLRGIFPDPKSAVSLWCIDVRCPNIIDFEDALGVSLYGRSYDVLETIGHLDVRMGAGEILIEMECEMLRAEMRGYRIRSTSAATGQTLVKPRVTGEDHLLDAFRYLLIPMFEGGAPVAASKEPTVQEMLEKDLYDMMHPNLGRDLEQLQQRRAQGVLQGGW